MKKVLISFIAIYFLFSILLKTIFIKKDKKEKIDQKISDLLKKVAIVDMEGKRNSTNKVKRIEIICTF